MKTTNLRKPPTGALRFVASLMGRMDRALAGLFNKGAGGTKFRATKPFHKLAGYKGPKPLSSTDRERLAARGKNTKAYNRSLSNVQG